jgi:hypothetical protein
MPLLRKETTASATTSKTVMHAIARTHSERCVRLWDDRCGGYGRRCLGPPTIVVLLKPDDANERCRACLALGKTYGETGQFALIRSRMATAAPGSAPPESRAEQTP